MVARNGRPLIGIVLIVLGILLLLQTLGILRVSLWGLAIPIFLIALGVWGIWNASQGGLETGPERLAIPADGASRAAVHVRFGAGRLRIAGGAAPGEVLTGEFGAGVAHRVHHEGQSLRVELYRAAEAWAAMIMPAIWGQRPEWNIRLAHDMPISLQLETGACESEIDLSQTQVNWLRLQTGASGTRLTLPARVDLVRAEVEAGAASVRIRVPEGVAARIRRQGGLAEIRINEQRFPRSGEVFQSEGYDNAVHRIDLDVQAGVGSVEVE